MDRAVEIQLLRLPDVLAMLGLSASTLANLRNRRCKYFDPTFPCPIPLSNQGRSVAWYRHELETWIEARAALRTPPGATKMTPSAHQGRD